MADASSLSSVPTLAALEASLSAEEKDLAAMLLSAGQAHVFAGWGDDLDAVHAFFAQAKTLHAAYPGGLPAYVANAKKLLADSAAGVNPFEGYTPEVPTGVSLDFASPEFLEFEAAGRAGFAKAACVLVAGGLGERLGYKGIKVALPTEISTGRPYLGLYCDQIKSLQAAAGGDAIPLAIMTSDDTHALTVELLAANANFGLADGQVTVIKQDKVPALVNNDAHFSMASPYALETKPHGHGDVHTLLHSSGLAAKWAADGRTHVLFFQDTNGLCFTTAVAALGVSIKRGFALNSVCVPRKAKDAVGAIASLKHVDGSALTCNVEYNQLEPLLMATLGKGDENDESGYSPFPGNINQLWAELGAYTEFLGRTGGLVPEFVNPKYADAAKTTFTKPTRLECMMQDLPKLLAPSAVHGFSTFPEWTYSPVKNSLTEAAKKAALGVLPRCASEGELEFYEAACKRLRTLGADVAPTAPWPISGFELPHGPHVVLDPALGVTLDDLRPHFPSPADVHIAAGSTLIVRGGNVTIHKLNLKGTLVIDASAGATVTIADLTVDNAGWELVPLREDAAVPDALLIRGYDIVKHATEELAYADAETYTVG